jgi:pimeloyl-ACP methyl ester carboxylesterase
LKPIQDDLAHLPESLGLTALRLDLPRLQFHAAAAGTESGDLVVLLDGFPENRYSWRHQIPALATAGLFVVAPDQCGYGLSEKAPPYDTETLARDIVDLVHALGRERAYLVGHD